VTPFAASLAAILTPPPRHLLEGLTDTCRQCEGTGWIGTGGLIGPCEHRRKVKCGTCSGSGRVPVPCVERCGRQAIGRDDEGEAFCAVCAEWVGIPIE
jgi:hypothetical protein